MKKLFSILMMVAAMTAMVACGEKDDPQPTPGDPANNDTSLVETTWHFAGDEYTSDITFKDATKIYHHEHYSDDNTTWNYWGTYTYDGTNGSATLSCFGNPEHFTFKVNGDKLTVYFEGEEIVHTKVAYQDPGDDPGDNSDAPETIGNTKYKVETGTMGAEGNELVSVFFGNGHESHTDTPAYVGNATVHHDYYADSDTQMEYYVGSYTYHNSDGTGTITLMDVETDETVGTATFSISGSTLTLNLLGETFTLALEQ